ncbi:DEIH-box ATPase [Xylographa bjoerkii]|nr:DEIH-box ATPase [Xylographa bjoerkii]
MEPSHNGQFEFFDDPINVLEGTALELSAAAGFDVSRSGILFVARQSTVKQRTTFKHNVYYITKSSLTRLGIQKPSALIVAGLEGASSSPVFSPDGQSAAFLQKPKGLYEDDKSKIVLVPNIDVVPITTEVVASIEGKGSWALSPDGYMVEGRESKMLSSANSNGAPFGLHSSQVEEVHYQGAEDHEIHAWVIKPSDFVAGKKYPLLYAIHGGPSNAWIDIWWDGTWNLAVFAEQGYVVFAPNITGSTGFGEEFAKRAYND